MLDKSLSVVAAAAAALVVVVVIVVVVVVVVLVVVVAVVAVVVVVVVLYLLRPPLGLHIVRTLTPPIDHRPVLHRSPPLHARLGRRQRRVYAA